MGQFSRVSRTKLETADPRLIFLFEEVVNAYDCSILSGHRNRTEQDAAFRDGRSDKPWPTSLHNRRPSLAIDASPYPVRWSQKNRFYHFAGYVKGVAESLGIAIRWGGDWDSDLDFTDQTLNDLVHFEIKE